MAVRNTKAPTGDGIERRRAVVVGIQHFRGSDELRYSVTDAQRVTEVLRKHGFEVTLIHDGPGGAARGTITKEQVLAAVADVMKLSDEDDLVVFYASSHGVRVDGRPYLTMADTPVTKDGWKEAYRDRGLPLADLFTALRGRPRWVSVFLDVCEMGLGIDPTVGEAMQHVDDRAGSFGLLSGSSATGKSFDDNGGAVFTRFLIEGLTGAASEPDGSIRFASLARHVQRGVSAWTATDGRDKTKPQAAVMRLEVSDLTVVPAPKVHELVPRLTAKITCAAWSPDGRRIATTAEDCTLRLWDPITRRQVLGSMQHPVIAPTKAHPEGETCYGYLGGVAFFRDGLTMASCGNEGTVRTWQVPGANEVPPIPPEVGAICTKVAWHPRERLLAASSGRGVELYRGDDLNRLTPVRTLTGHDGIVWCVAFAPDGELVSGGKDGTVRAWDTASGRCTRQWQVGGPVWAIAVSPDGARVLTGGADDPVGPTLHNEVREWDRKTGKELRRFVGHGGGVTSAVYTRAGDRIATTSYDGHARVWSTDRGDRLLDGRVETVGDAAPPEAYAAAFDPDGKRLFVGYADGRGRIYTLG